VGIVPPREFQPMTDEADDYRPNSRWAFAVDPSGRVEIGIIHEFIGVGDRIPLHTHAVDEALLLLEGRARVRVGDETQDVEAGSTIFIPAGEPHGTTNTGAEECRVVAIFPTTLVDICMLERTPMPGTEDRAPTWTDWNMRTGEIRLLDGEGRPTGEVLQSAAVR
jgi:quercetin dioxygenase-like cupin family protein